MPLPTRHLHKSHELWQKAMGKCNARAWDERQALLTIQEGNKTLATTDVATFKTDDIDEYFQKNGRGTQLLEYEFTPDTPEPVDYTQGKSGLVSKFWFWTHKITKASVKRFATSSGKSMDSGALSKYLHRITKRQSPLAYARAKKILSLNESRREQSLVSGVRRELGRKDLLGQQVCLYCVPNLFLWILTNLFCPFCCCR